MELKLVSDDSFSDYEFQHSHRLVAGSITVQLTTQFASVFFITGATRVTEEAKLQLYRKKGLLTIFFRPAMHSQICLALFLVLCAVGSNTHFIMARELCNDARTVKCIYVQQYCRDPSYEAILRQYCPKTCRFCTEHLHRKYLRVIHVGLGTGD